MIQRLVKLHFEAQNVDAFLDIFEKTKDKIRGMDGCEGLELLQDIHDPSIFFTVSIWKDQTFLDIYRNSELFKKIWPKTKILFKEKAQAWSTNIVSN